MEADKNNGSGVWSYFWLRHKVLRLLLWDNNKFSKCMYVYKVRRKMVQLSPMSPYTSKSDTVHNVLQWDTQVVQRQRFPDHRHTERPEVWFVLSTNATCRADSQLIKICGCALGQT